MTSIPSNLAYCCCCSSVQEGCLK